jgi:hypothetical protein
MVILGMVYGIVLTTLKKKHLDSQVVDFPLRNEKIMWVKQESA